MNEELTLNKPHRATFQLILKKPVYPQFFIAQKLHSSVQAKASAIGDYDIETVKEWISISYYTTYQKVPKRLLLGFKIELPSEMNEAMSRRIIESDEDEEGLDSFGSLLQADTENVEALFRYEDDTLLRDINKYHPEIFELEMKLREVLNYILCYNLKNHDVFDFIREFDEIHIKSHRTNEKIKKYLKERKTNKALRHPFSYDFENEIFHLVVKDYLGFEKPKRRNYQSMKARIGKATSIDELKKWLDETVSFSKLNKDHLTFIQNIKTRINPIENLRNDIMHNRKISSETIESFESAKRLMLDWINEFWTDELTPIDTEEVREVNSLKQAEYILKILIDSVIKDDVLYFTDLTLDEQQAEDTEDLKSQFLDIINDHLEIDDQESLEILIDKEIEKSNSF